MRKNLILCGVLVGIVSSLIFIPMKRKEEKRDKEFYEQMNEDLSKIVSEAFPKPDFKVYYSD